VFHETENQAESVDESMILVWKEGKNAFTSTLCNARPCNARERNLNFLHMLVIWWTKVFVSLMYTFGFSS